MEITEQFYFKYNSFSLVTTKFFQPGVWLKSQIKIESLLSIAITRSNGMPTPGRKNERSNFRLAPSPLNTRLRNEIPGRKKLTTKSIASYFLNFP